MNKWNMVTPYFLLLVSLCLAGDSTETCRAAENSAVEKPKPACTSNDPAVVFDKITPYEQNLLEREGFEWIETRSPHFRIYCEKGSPAEKQLDHLEERAEEAISRALEILDEPAYNRGIRLVMVGSRDRMEDLIGQRYKGFAPIGHSVVLLVFNEEIRPYLRHEIMHKVSINLWGEPETWLREGSATYADGKCLFYPDPLDTIAAYLLDRRMLHPVSELMSDFDELTMKNDLITYLQSGSFFQFLYENYGRCRIKELWQHGSTGITGIFGKTAEELEAQWLEHLESIDVSETGVDWEELLEKGCG